MGFVKAGYPHVRRSNTWNDNVNVKRLPAMFDDTLNELLILQA